MLGGRTRSAAGARRETITSWTRPRAGSPGAVRTRAGSPIGVAPVAPRTGVAVRRVAPSVRARAACGPGARSSRRPTGRAGPGAGRGPRSRPSVRAAVARAGPRAPEHRRAGPRPTRPRRAIPRRIGRGPRRGRARPRRADRAIEWTRSWTWASPTAARRRTATSWTRRWTWAIRTAASPTVTHLCWRTSSVEGRRPDHRCRSDRQWCSTALRCPTSPAGSRRPGARRARRWAIRHSGTLPEGPADPCEVPKRRPRDGSAGSSPLGCVVARSAAGRARPAAPHLLRDRRARRCARALPLMAAAGAPCRRRQWQRASWRRPAPWRCRQRPWRGRVHAAGVVAPSRGVVGRRPRPVGATPSPDALGSRPEHEGAPPPR